MIKILITGGSGFIGTNLVTYYLDKGLEVVNVDVAAPKIADHRPNWANVDILDKNKLSEVFRRFMPTHVVHLAARTDLRGQTLADYSSNIEGVENVISSINNCGSVVRAVFASSMLVCNVGYVPRDYDDYSPATIYGESKVLTEKIIKNNLDLSCEWTIVRPTSIWGPWFGEPYKNFFDLILKKRYVNFKGHTCTKTYGFIGNAVFHIDRILFTCNHLVNHKLFYLGDFPPINISEWSDEIRSELKLGPLVKVPFLIFKLAAMCGDLLVKFGLSFPMTSFRLKNMTTNNIVNLRDLHDAVGFPPYNRKEGIQKTISWLLRSNKSMD